MTKKTPTSKDSKKKAKVSHPGMMGDGTEEQNLGERGNPAARIKKKEVVAAFGKRTRQKPNAHDASSSSRALASLRSSVLKPSMNQP